MNDRVPDARSLPPAENSIYRTRLQKRRQVIALLTDSQWAKWSDGVIAREARVSQPFVSKLRRELSQNVLSVRQTRRRGADKVIRNISRIGKRELAPEALRQLVLDAIHLGAWTIKELIDDTELPRQKLQTILTEAVKARIIITTTRNNRDPNGGRPETLYLPGPNSI